MVVVEITTGMEIAENAAERLCLELDLPLRWP
jgi:hypothetical protein